MKNKLLVSNNWDKLDFDDVAKYIDHTLLKPDATEEEIIRVCKEANEFKFFSVCVNPFWAKLARKNLDNNIKLCIVIGFPLGMTTTQVKIFETSQVIKDGADEVDMVINIGALKSSLYDVVKADIISVVSTALKESNNKAIVKVILETCLLSNEEKIIACKLAKEARAHFVKTSTGFSKSGATVEDIKLMRDAVGPLMGVKASGGIRTKEDLENMIKAGANRIGASASVDIIKGYLNNEKNNNY